MTPRPDAHALRAGATVDGVPSAAVTRVISRLGAAAADARARHDSPVRPDHDVGGARGRVVVEQAVGILMQELGTPAPAAHAALASLADTMAVDVPDLARSLVDHYQHGRTTETGTR